MRRKAGLLSVVLLVAACVAEAAEPVADATTTIAEAATATAPHVVEIPGRAVVWDVGTTYAASSFIVPVSSTPEREGWRSLGARSAWVAMTWFDPGSVEDSISLLLVAHRPSDPIEAVVESIIGVDGVEALTDPVETSLAGASGVSFDVEGSPHRLRQAQACSGGSGFFFNIHSLGLIGDGYQDYGVPACGLVRVWVVRKDGSTVTVLASTLQSERFDEFTVVVERLLDSMTFEAP